MSSNTVWHAQNNLWKRVGSNPTSPGHGGNKPIIGQALGSQLEADWETSEAQLGVLKIRRSYLGAQSSLSVYTTTYPTFASTNAGIDVGRRESVWSFKPANHSCSDFASGLYDSWFSSFLDSIPSGHLTTIIMEHEPEGAINTGTFTLADWQAANNHMGAMIHAKGRSELRSAICLIGAWTFDPSNHTSTKNLEYWDSGFDTNIDYIGFDPYDLVVGNYTDLANNAPFLLALDWANSHYKPIMLCEFGCREDAGGDTTKKATWIQDSYNFGVSNGFYAMMYFNYDTGSPSVALTTSSLSISTYAAINADSKV